MKLRTPIFLPFALALAFGLAMANHNGWSLVQALAARTWQRTVPNTQHK